MRAQAARRDPGTPAHRLSVRDSGRTKTRQVAIEKSAHAVVAAAPVRGLLARRENSAATGAPVGASAVTVGWQLVGWWPASVLMVMRLLAAAKYNIRSPRGSQPEPASIVAESGEGI